MDERKLPLLLVAALLLPAAARGAEPLTDNEFNIDATTGPILGSSRVVAMGGAFTALATSIDGVAWNPASYGSRTLWEPNWFEWDATVGILLPGGFSANDYFNNGKGQGVGVDEFVFLDSGLRLQFANLGVGGLYRLQSYAVPTFAGRAEITVHNIQYGGAWMFFAGQLIAGLGGRTVVMDIILEGEELVPFQGTGLEAGLVWRPVGWPIRIGAAGRTPVISEQIAGQPSSRTGDQIDGFYLPGRVYLPWDAQAGVAVQIGKRPLNRCWRPPPDPHDQLLALLKDRWCEREREQAIVELERQGQPAEMAGECPRLAYRPRDRQWWRGEETRRRQEEQVVDARIEHRRDALRRKADLEYERLPRFYWLLSADVLVIGQVPDGVGIDAFLDQERRRSGEQVSVGGRIGSEIEPWPRRLKIRAGGYLEPGRNRGVGPRMHGTAGLDLRLFTWDLFGWIEPFSVRLGGMVDFAPRYFNWGVGVGLWH